MRAAKRLPSGERGVWSLETMRGRAGIAKGNLVSFEF